VETGLIAYDMDRRMSRWKAAGLHFLVCVAIAASVITLMIAVWYPSPLFRAMGGDHLVAIVIGVDVAIGPMITLVIFSPGKRQDLLRFDLMVIASLQLAALGYGVYVVAQARPAYIVFATDRFEVATANDILPQELAKVTRPEFREMPRSGPVRVGVVMPDDPGEQVRLMMSAAAGADLKTFPQYYVPYADQAQAAASRARPIALLRAAHPERKEQVAAAVAATGLEEDAMGFLPLRARRQDMAILVNAKDGAVMGYVAVDPW
jgi:hypothetical protein